MHVVHIVNK
jgi:glycine/D-amino acid oxidase-like deaminating enzyme